jgi:hypothetical protein
MNSTFEITLAVVAGVALGAAAVQGLHAQAKPKAWSVSELETLDAAARTAFVPVVQAAQKAAGARIFNTGGGRIVASEGAAPPPRVWPSPSGTAWSRRRHSTTRKPGKTLRRSVKRQSRQHSGTSSKLRSRPFPPGQHAVGTQNWQHLRLPEAVSLGGLVS